MTKFEFICVAPMIMLAALGILVLLIGTITDRFPKGRLNHWFPPEYFSATMIVPVLTMQGALFWAILHHGAEEIFCLNGAANPLITVDLFSIAMGFIAVAGTFVVMLMSWEYFGDHNTKNRGEYFALLFFATAAILFVTASTDLIMIYLAMEFLSISSYVLASYWKNDAKSSEAGLKYLIFGATSSAIMLYGMSMLYGLTNSTNLGTIASALSRGEVMSLPGALTAVIMVLVGLGFKIALVPFHLWAPDVYEGAPTPITAWLSVASKAAGLAVITRFLLVAIPMSSGVDWYTVVLILAGVSMTLGNLAAIPQKNIKRMLAYSSIAQVGYMLIGLLAAAATISPNSPDSAVKMGYMAVSNQNIGTSNYGLAGLMIYAASYLVMNLGVFAVVIGIEKRTGSSDIESFAGMVKRAPFFAWSLVLFMLSLAGIPPTAGFIGKLYVFAGAIQSARTDLLVLAIIAIANSVISIYYYFNVVRVVFMKDAETKAPLRPSVSLTVVVSLMLIFTFGIFVAAGPLINLVRAAIL
ncbi:MAG: NADH-quinone oxidoreductase subunit N [Armatimonadota bacterium]